MRIGIHAVGLLVVGSEVLDTRAHIIFLHTFDIGRSGLTGHHGILGVVLEVSSTQGVTHDVEGRSQQHVGTILLHLLTNGLTNLFYQLGIPRRGQQCSDGEVGAIVSGRVTITLGIDTKSGRTVGKNYGGNAQRVERVGGTGSTRHKTLSGTDDCIVARESFHTHANHEVGLVLERHLGHHLFLIQRVLSHIVGRITGCQQGSHAEGENNGFLHKL